MCIRDRYGIYVTAEANLESHHIPYHEIQGLPRQSHSCLLYTSGIAPQTTKMVKSDALKYAIAEAESEHGKEEITVNFAFW